MDVKTYGRMGGRLVWNYTSRPLVGDKMRRYIEHMTRWMLGRVRV